MANEGVAYNGLHVLGGGSILGGLVLGAIAAYIIDRKFKFAAGFALAGAVLTFFGFMHGERIGLAQTPVVAASYLIMSGILIACAKWVVVAAKPVEETSVLEGEGQPA
jgi:AGZA family xanthine/uracil permease-like MFS transporter